MRREIAKSDQIASEIPGQPNMRVDPSTMMEDVGKCVT